MAFLTLKMTVNLTTESVPLTNKSVKQTQESGRLTFRNFVNFVVSRMGQGLEGFFKKEFILKK